jgi:hypothetical protein
MLLQFETILHSPLTFPTLECLHLLGLAIGVGTIAAIDYRMLGWGFGSQKLSDLAGDLSKWNLIGLILAILAGGGLFASDPDLYYLNHSFQIKITLLTIALIFHFTVHQKRAFDDAPLDRTRWVGAVSLLLWASIVFGGIFIAFTGEAA